MLNMILKGYCLFEQALPWRDLPEDGLALQRVALHGAGAGEPVVVHAVLVHELLPICHLAVGKLSDD